MINLIGDDIHQETEHKVTKRKYHYNNIIVVATSICILIGISVAFIPMLMNHVKFSIQNGTLPGATEINPAVMYNGSIYYWNSMAGPVNKLPQGILPKGYEYVGDIKYNSDEKLTQDLQFIAKFEATGQLYYSKNDPDNVYICITTFWLDDAYVKFSSQ
jgi:hypothetical protein